MRHRFWDGCGSDCAGKVITWVAALTSWGQVEIMLGGDVHAISIEVLRLFQWEYIASIGWFECRRYIQLVKDLYIKLGTLIMYSWTLCLLSQKCEEKRYVLSPANGIRHFAASIKHRDAILDPNRTSQVRTDQDGQGYNGQERSVFETQRSQVQILSPRLNSSGFAKVSPVFCSAFLVDSDTSGHAPFRLQSDYNL